MSEELLMLKIWLLRLINRKKTAVYLSGKISNATPYELETFSIAEAYYRRRGFFVVNPYKLFMNDGGRTWYYYMRLDIAIMALIFKSGSESLFVSLPTWMDSAGAITERDLATSLNIPIFNMSWGELQSLRESLSA